MKKLTSILITLLFAFNVEGQEVNDPGFLAPRDTAKLRIIFGGGSGSTVFDSTIIDQSVKSDTVLSLMMVTDTARFETYKRIIVDTIGSDFYVRLSPNLLDTLYHEQDLSVKTIIGYHVREVHCCINGNTGELAYYQPVPYYTHLEYLDEKKQPLSKSIIVWQSINQK